MREGNGSQRQGVWLDNGGGVKNGYGAERNARTVEGRLRQWQIEGWQNSDGSERNNVDTRQSSRGLTDSDVGAEWARQQRG